MMWWNGYCGAGYPGSGWGMMHGIIPLVILAILVLGVVLLIRNGRSAAKPEKRGALEVLEERYARGEIDREEYLQKRQDLGV